MSKKVNDTIDITDDITDTIDSNDIISNTDTNHKLNRTIIVGAGFVVRPIC